MQTLDEALRVIEAFNEARVEYVVVGGVAVNLHGLVRATEDMDVFVKPDAQNIARVRQALAAAEAGIRRGDIILELDQSTVKSADDLAKKLSSSDESVLALVKRGENTLYVPLKKDG